LKVFGRQCLRSKLEVSKAHILFISKSREKPNLILTSTTFWYVFPQSLWKNSTFPKRFQQPILKSPESLDFKEFLIVAKLFYATFGCVKLLLKPKNHRFFHLFLRQSETV